MRQQKHDQKHIGMASQSVFKKTVNVTHNM
jgi:hypothetical protein